MSPRTTPPAVDARFADLHVDHLTLELGERNLFEALVDASGERSGRGVLRRVSCRPRRCRRQLSRRALRVGRPAPGRALRGRRAFTVFADSLDSLVYLARCAARIATTRSPTTRSRSGCASSHGKTAPSLDPKRRDTEFLFFRSRWICALLQNRLGEVGALFNADFNQIVPADQLAARYDACEKFIPTALYSMWRAYLFDEPELARYLEIGRRHKARLVRDATSLIDELRAGRKQLGAIARHRRRTSRRFARSTSIRAAPRSASARPTSAPRPRPARRRSRTTSSMRPSPRAGASSRGSGSTTASRIASCSRGSMRPRRPRRSSPSSTSCAAIERYAKRLAIARLAEELSPELEAVLAGSLVRDDTLADALAPVAAALERRRSAGLGRDRSRARADLQDDRAARALRHGAAVLARRQRSDPRASRSTCATEPVPHFHFVTYGFSDLFQKETDDPEVSGFGFELTFRLARAGVELTSRCRAWAMDFLQNLGRYVFSTGNRFAAGHKMGLDAPIAQAADRDQRGRVHRRSRARRDQLAVRQSEVLADRRHHRRRISADPGVVDRPGLLEILKRRLPMLVTDLARKSVLADAATSIVVKKRVELEGSTEELTVRGRSRARYQRRPADRARCAVRRGDSRGRCAGGSATAGRTRCAGPSGALHLRASEPSRGSPSRATKRRSSSRPRSRPSSRTRLRAGLVGDYRFERWPALRIVVTPSFIRDGDGVAHARSTASPIRKKRRR